MSRRAARTVPRTFLFADLRGYTAYVERAWDAEAAHLLRTYRGLVRRAVTREQGAEVKTEGDSFYVVFDSSAAAVRCAVAIQRAAARQRGEALPIGIGIHAGEATPFDAQYVGSAVNIAARLASAATPGEILVSETVRSLVRTTVRLDLDDRGPLALKGVAEAVRAYAIRLGDSPSVPPPEPPPTGPASAMAALLRGDLDAAARVARSLPTGAPAEARCDALAALTVLAAARGDVEAALGRAEPLLTAALHAADRAWIRTAYALRAWLYGLARQPAEGRAELARAFERPGTRGEACLALLLATTLLGSSSDAERLRQVALSCTDATLQQACAAVADVLEDPAGRPAILAPAVGPFIDGLLQAQLAARMHARLPR